MVHPEVIRIEGVSKRFTVHKDKSIKERLVNLGRSRTHVENYEALKDVNFSIKAGESVGLAGANGSGKSTLLKVIGGILAPSSGEVLVRGRIAALLELGAGFHPDLTGRENVYLNGAILGMSEEAVDSQFESIVDFSGVREFIDTQVKFYSSGMYVRLAFAVAVHSDPDILLVDEVLAVGDEPFQTKCMAKIREFQTQGRTIILVSHSAEQIIDVCDRAVVLEHGRIVEEGAARDAMAFLHARYQLEATKAARAAGDLPECSIDMVKIEDGFETDNEGCEVFRPGGALKVGIKLTTPEMLNTYAVHLDLETDRGRHVLGVDTRRSNVVPPSFKGATTVIVTLPDLALGEGNYTLSASVFDEDGIEIAVARNATSLPVRSGGPSVGLISVQPTFKFQKIAND